MMNAAAQLRDAGQDAAIAADVAPHRGHGDFIRAAIDWHATHLDTPWTCDDVRFMARGKALVAGVDFTPSDNLLPALIGNYVGRGVIVRVADATSKRRSRRAARVGRYLGARYAGTP